MEYIELTSMDIIKHIVIWLIIFCIIDYFVPFETITKAFSEAVKL